MRLAFYDSYVWKALRENVLVAEPLCRHCASKGLTIIATQVDHIMPIEEGGSPKSMDNLQPLCDSCHSKKTRKENEPPKAITETLGFNDVTVEKETITKKGSGKRSNKAIRSDMGHSNSETPNIIND